MTLANKPKLSSLKRLCRSKPQLDMMNLAASLAASWALAGVETVPTDRVTHRCLCDAFREARPSLERHLRVNIVMRLHAENGDSANVAAMFQCLERLGYARPASPPDGSVYLNLPRDSAEAILAEIPGEIRAIFGKIAAKVVAPR